MAAENPWDKTLVKHPSQRVAQFCAQGHIVGHVAVAPPLLWNSQRASAAALDTAKRTKVSAASAKTGLL